MKVLVTGASGFIGSHILEYLEKREYSVVGCGRKNLEKVNYFCCDLTRDLPDMEAEVIIHAAAIGSLKASDFNDYYYGNVVATQNILTYAKKYHVRRIVYMAAVSSYGEVDTVLNENSPHNNPDDYGLTKYMAEKLVKCSGIPYYVLVLPGVVGRGAADNWIMRTAKILHSNQDYYYYNQEGRFNNIVDIVDLCVFVEKLIQDGSQKSETYLLGTRELMQIGEVVTFLKKGLTSNSQLYLERGNYCPFYLDVSRAIQAGYEPRRIEEILLKICEEMRKA